MLLSVTAFVIYNIALAKGGMSNEVFRLALAEIPVEFVIAFLAQALIAYPVAHRLALRLVDPKTDRPALVAVAVTCCTVAVMCPLMSLAATLLYNGLTPEFLADWFQKLACNFPFAFFVELFLIGPVVRWVFRHTLGRRNAPPQAA